MNSETLSVLRAVMVSTAMIVLLPGQPIRAGIAAIILITAFAITDSLYYDFEDDYDDDDDFDFEDDDDFDNDDDGNTKLANG